MNTRNNENQEEYSMTREEARDIVYEGIQALLDCKDTPLTEDLDLVDELGFSSLTYFFLLVRIEEKSGKRIPERKARRVETVKDIIDILAAL